MQWWCSAQGVPWSWDWTPYPGVWVFVAMLAAAYRRMVRGAAPDRTRLALCGAGLASLWIALDWPVGALGGGYLASVHMVQFLLVALVAPPFLLSAVPEHVWVRLRGRPAVVSLLDAATRPLHAIVLFDLTVFVTHAPAVVDGLMASQLGSFAIDMAWLAAGLVFWWPLAAPVPERRGFPDILRLVYLVAQAAAMTPLFVWMTFSELPLYATYELAPRAVELSAREDQQAAGLLMKSAGMLVLMLAAGVIFLRAARREGLRRV